MHFVSYMEMTIRLYLPETICEDCEDFICGQRLKSSHASMRNRIRISLVKQRLDNDKCTLGGIDTSMGLNVEWMQVC